MRAFATNGFEKAFGLCLCIVGILLAALLSDNIGIAAASKLHCKKANVSVNAKANSDARLACAASARAINFLVKMGMRQERGIEVEVVDRIPFAYEHVVGMYDWKSDKAYILTKNKFYGTRIINKWFDSSNNVSLYESYISHEVAHALSAQNFLYKNPSIAVQEFIAGVVQIATMPETERQKILSRYKRAVFDSFFQINSISYEFNQAMFAVKSYRFFLNMNSKKRFLKELLDGTIRFSDSLPY